MAFTIVVNVVGQEDLDRMAASVDKLHQKDNARLKDVIALTNEQTKALSENARAAETAGKKAEESTARKVRYVKEENQAIAEQVAQFKKAMDGYSGQINAISRMIAQTDMYKKSLHSMIGAEQIAFERKSGATRVINEQLLALEKLKSAQNGYSAQLHADTRQMELSIRVQKQEVEIAYQIAQSKLKAQEEARKLSDATYQETLRMEQRNKVMRESLFEQDKMIRKYEQLQEAAASYAKGATPGLVTGSKIVTAPFLDNPTVKPADMALQEQYTKLQKDLLLLIPKLKGQFELLTKARTDEARATQAGITALTEASKVEERLNALKERSHGQTQKNIDEIAKLTSAEKVRTAAKTQEYALQEKLAALEARKTLQTSSDYEKVQKLTQAERAHNAVLTMKEQLETKIAMLNARKSQQVQQLIAEIKKLEAAERGAAGSSIALGTSLGGVNQLTASMRAGMTAIGAQFGIYTSGTILAAGATYGFINAIKQVITAGKDFQVEIARVNAVMGLTDQQIERLKETTIGLAASSRYTAKEVAQAFREMGMAGIGYQESMAGIRAVLSLASIGNMDFAQATDIATNVTFGFGLEMTKLSHVVDVMAKTVTSSNQDIKQLGNTMSYAAPIASSFGISLELTAAMTEVLANSGIKASRAGTALRRTFTALLGENEKATAELAELGVQVNMLATDMDQELMRVLKELNKATNGATTNVGNLTKAVGLYAAPGFLKLVAAANETKTSLDEIYKATQDVEGAAYEMQKRIEDTLAVDWDILKSALEAVKVMFFELYEGGLRDVVQSTSAWIQGLSANKELIAELSGNIKEFTKAIVILFSIIAGSAVLSGLGKMVLSIVGALTKFGGAASIAATATAKWGGVASKVFAAARLATWTGLIYAAGTALYELYKGFNRLKDVEPVDVGAIRNFTEAQSALSGDLGYENILEANENIAVAAAQSKLAIEELGRQRQELEETLDLKWELAAEIGAQGLSDEIGALNEQIEGVGDSLRAVGDDYTLMLDKLARKEVLEAQEVLVTVRLDLEDNQKQIADLEKQIESEVEAVRNKLSGMPATREQNESMNAIREFFGFKPKDLFVEALRKMSPAAVEVHEKIVALEKSQEALLKVQKEARDLEEKRKANKDKLDPLAMDIIEQRVRKEASAESTKQLGIIENLLGTEARYRESIRATDDSLLSRIRTLREQTDAVEAAATTIGMEVFSAEDMVVEKKMLDEKLTRNGELIDKDKRRYAELTAALAPYTAAVDMAGASLGNYQDNLKKVVEEEEKLRSELLKETDKWFMFEPESTRTLEENAIRLREIGKERRALERQADEATKKVGRPGEEDLVEQIRLKERLLDNEKEYNAALQQFDSDQAATVARFKELKKSSEEYAESQMTLKDAISDVAYFEELRAKILAEKADIEHRAEIGKLPTDQLIELARATEQLEAADIRLTAARSFRIQQEAELNKRYAESSKLSQEQIGYTRSLADEFKNLSDMQARRNELLAQGAIYQEIYDQGFGLTLEMSERWTQITEEQERVTGQLNASQEEILSVQTSLVAKAYELAEAQEEVNKEYATFSERGKEISRLRSLESDLSKEHQMILAFLEAKPGFWTYEETMWIMKALADLEAARAKLTDQTNKQTEAEKALREELYKSVASLEKLLFPKQARPVAQVKDDLMKMYQEQKIYKDILDRGGSLPAETYDRMRAILKKVTELTEELTEAEREQQEQLKKSIDIRKLLVDVYTAEGRTRKALELSRILELEQAEAAHRALIEQRHVAEDKMALDQMAIQLMEKQGRTQEVVAAKTLLARRAYSDAEFAIWSMMQAIDAETEAQEKRKSLLSEIAALLSAAGKEEAALQVSRMAEIEAAEGVSKAILRMKHAYEDLDKVIEKAQKRQSISETFREDALALTVEGDALRESLFASGMLEEALEGYNADPVVDEVKRVKDVTGEIMVGMFDDLGTLGLTFAETIREAFDVLKAHILEVSGLIQSEVSRVQGATSSVRSPIGAMPGGAQAGSLLDFIGKYEAPRGYSQMYSGVEAKFGVRDLESMTIAEIIAYQRKVGPIVGSSAAGKYQFMPDTLAETARGLGISLAEKFNAQTQDQLAMGLLKGLKVDQWHAGEIDSRAFLSELSKRWAAFPDPATGKSRYGDKMNNKALVSTDAAIVELDAIRAMGGTAQQAQEQILGLTQAVDPGLTEAMGGVATATQEVTGAVSSTAEVLAQTRVQVQDAASIYDAIVDRYETAGSRVAELQAQIEDLGKLNLAQGLTPEQAALMDQSIAQLKTELDLRQKTAELIDRNAAKELQAGRELTRVRKATGQELEDMKLRFNEVYAAQTAHYELMAKLIVAYKSGAISLAEFNKQIRESALSTIEAEGGWKRYWASLIKGTQSFGDAMIDVADTFRQKLIDGIVEGKLQLEDFGKLFKRKLAEITVNNITTLIIGGLTGASAQYAQATSGAQAAAGVTGSVGGLGGLTQSLGSIGKFVSGLGGNSYGSGIASIFGGANVASGAVYGTSFGSQQSMMLAAQESGMGASAGMFSSAGSVPNWGYGVGGALGGVAGGYIGGQMFGDKGYSQAGGALGGAGGAQLGMAYGASFGPIGVVVGGILGAVAGGAGGGFLGSLFGGGDKPKPRAELSVEQGYMTIKSTNDAWGDASELYAGAAEINKALDDLSTMLGDAAWAARNAFSHAGQTVTPENAGTWMKDNYESMIRAMIEATESDALSQAGGELFGEILGKAFDAAGDDPQAIASAMATSKAFFDSLTAEANRALLFDVGMASSDFDTVSRSLYEMTNRMKQSGEELTATLARITQAMAISTTTNFINPGFMNMEFSEGGDRNTLAYDKSLTDYGKYLQSNVDYWHDQILNGVQAHRSIHEGYYQAAIAARDAYLWVNTEEEKNLVLVEKRVKIIDAMAEKMGGMDTLNAAQNAYYELAYTEEERGVKQEEYARNQISSWNEQMGRTGDSTITSIEQLRVWMETLDLQTDAGQEAYLSGLRVAEMFGILKQALDAAGESLMSLEDFLEALKPPEIKEAEDKEKFEKIFSDINVTLPLDKGELYEMLNSGNLNQSQIDALLANAEFILEYLQSSSETPETRDYSTNSTIRELEQALDEWTGKLDSAKAVFDNATEALHSLKSIKGETEEVREDLLQQARSAISAAELPDNINSIISDLGQVNEEDFASYEAFQAAVNENENLLLQLKNRAGTEMNYAQRQVDLLEEQIRLAKEALEQEDITLQKYIEELQDKLLDSELRTQELWADGFGALIDVNTKGFADVVAVSGGVPTVGSSAVTDAIGVTNHILVDSFAVTDTILVDSFAVTDSILANGFAAMLAALAVPAPYQDPPPPADTPAHASSMAESDEQMALLIAEVQALRAESSTNQTAIAVHSRRVADLIARWEGEGIPADREDYLKGILINSRTSVTDPCT